MNQPDARVTPYPGVRRRDLLETLEFVQTELGNVRGKSTIANELPTAYLEWVNDSIRMLRSQLPSHEIDRLLLTRRYWAIQTAQGFESAKLAETELDDRAAALARTIDWLKKTDQKWNAALGRLVVADSGFFCNHEKKLRDIPFADLLELRDQPVRLMVPILVLDELDSLKQHNNKHIRWRAGHTLGVLDELLSRDGTGTLRENDLTPLRTGGSIDIEVFFDPPHHRRLPINDDEIIDRGLAIQAEAERDIVFWTFDTAQSTRARFAGLDVKKFKNDLGTDPLVGTAAGQRKAEG